MEKIVIDQLQLNDIPAAADLIATLFAERWREPATKEFGRLFDQEQHPTYVFVARENAKIIGTAACMEQYFSEHIYGICWVGVLENYRRKGLASKLISVAETFAKQDLAKGKSCTLLLTTDKTSLYSKLGYTVLNGPLHDGGNLMSKVIGQNK